MPISKKILQSNSHIANFTIVWQTKHQNDLIIVYLTFNHLETKTIHYKQH